MQVSIGKYQLRAQAVVFFTHSVPTMAFLQPGPCSQHSVGDPSPLSHPFCWHSMQYDVTKSVLGFYSYIMCNIKYMGWRRKTCFQFVPSRFASLNNCSSTTPFQFTDHFSITTRMKQWSQGMIASSMFHSQLEVYIPNPSDNSYSYLTEVCIPNTSYYSKILLTLNEVYEFKTGE